MLAAGLTGGIGSGKSTVAGMLSARGAVVIDADLIAREVVAPGGPAYEPLVRRFGSSALAADGQIDRPALAAMAFADQKALADLNAITHPAIGAVMAARRFEHRGDGEIVILDIPLLVAAHRGALQLDAVIVVDCPLDLALERLVRLRAMEPSDAEARIAAQPSREERLVGADFVLDNAGTRDHLAGQVDSLWARLVELEAAGR